MRFLCDSMLGKTATYLRLLGFDTAYVDTKLFDVKLEKAFLEERVFLTRDTKIQKMKQVPKYYFVWSNFLEIQVYEIINSLKITQEDFKPFSRCLRCNTELEMIDKEYVKDRVPDYVFVIHKSFSYCRGCDSIYWKGTHYQRMKRWVEIVEDNISNF